MEADTNRWPGLGWSIFTPVVMQNPTPGVVVMQVEVMSLFTPKYKVLIWDISPVWGLINLGQFFSSFLTVIGFRLPC